MKFARYGGLSSVNQEGYRAQAETFHSPPASRGFYAFVWPYYEMFLLGGYANMVWKSGSKFTYARDKSGKIIDDKHTDYERIANTDNNGYWSVQAKKFYAHKRRYPDNYNDPDYDKKVDMLDKEWEDNHKDDPKWVLVERPSPRIFEFDGNLWHHLSSNLKQHKILGTHGNWVKTSVYDYRLALEKEMHDARKDEMSFARHFPSAKSPFRFYSKDHLEVFIEKL